MLRPAALTLSSSKHPLSPQGISKTHGGWRWACPVLARSLHLLSFWVMVPFSSFPAMEPSTLLASLAKSRSRTSAGETGTMANASLSSFTGEVPIWKARWSLWNSLLDWEGKTLIKHCIYGTWGNPKSLELSCGSNEWTQKNTWKDVPQIINSCYL